MVDEQVTMKCPLSRSWFLMKQQQLLTLRLMI